MTKCKSADRYKAMRPPRCNCDACKLKWATAQLQKIERALKPARKRKRKVIPMHDGHLLAAMYNDAFGSGC